MIMEQAKTLYARDKEAKKHKSLRWMYNLTYFHTYYFTRNPLVQRMLFKLELYPEFFEIEPTTICNMGCIFCENTYWSNNIKRRHMTFEEFKHIVDQFPDLKWIGMTGIGQSWANPDYMKMIRYVKKDPDIFIEFFTPFLYMNEKRSRELIELGVDKIYCSIEAATARTYHKLRPRSNFEVVIKNIKRFDEIKKQLDTPKYPRLCFHWLLMTENKDELIPFLEMLADMDINIDFVQISRLLHSFPEIEGLFWEPPMEYREAVINKGKELGITLRWNANTTPRSQQPDPNRCVAWTQPFIFADGTVIPCCACNEGNAREFQIETGMGNVFQQSFKDIWYGERFRKLRRMLYHNKIPKLCTRCPLFKV